MNSKMREWLMRRQEVMAFLKEYGFRLATTGGGCTGYALQLKEAGLNYLITDGDATAPESINEFCTVTLYNEGGDALASEELPDLHSLHACLVRLLITGSGMNN